MGVFWYILKFLCFVFTVYYLTMLFYKTEITLKYTQLFLGIIIGIVVYLKCTQDIKSNIDLTLATTINNIGDVKQNHILIHLLIISLIIILSSLIVGFIPLTIYYIYEGASIGFLLASFIHYKKIKGIYYALVFILTNKFLNLIFLSYLLYITYKYIKIFIKNNYKITNLNNYLLRCFITLIVILLNDIFLYYYGNTIINILI